VTYGPQMIQCSGRLTDEAVARFIYDPLTRSIRCEIDGQLRNTHRRAALKKYRGIRARFMEQLSAMLGGAVAVVELDEAGRPARFVPTQAHQAGHA
jgi:hypothetical protein